MTTELILEHLDELFDDAINISREIRKLEIQPKQEDTVMKNIQKIAENILVATKRISKIEYRDES